MSGADLSYLHPAKLSQLNDIAAKHTYFQTFAELVDTKNNYRAILYPDREAFYAVRDINTLAEHYDEYMRKTNDPRRIYRI